MAEGGSGLSKFFLVLLLAALVGIGVYLGPDLLDQHKKVIVQHPPSDQHRVVHSFTILECELRLLVKMAKAHPKLNNDALIDFGTGTANTGKSVDGTFKRNPFSFYVNKGKTDPTVTVLFENFNISRIDRGGFRAGIDLGAKIDFNAVEMNVLNQADLGQVPGRYRCRGGHQHDSPEEERNEYCVSRKNHFASPPVEIYILLNLAWI